MGRGDLFRYKDAMMPAVNKFLNELIDIDLQGKIGLAFGSYGWGMELMQESGFAACIQDKEVMSDYVILFI